MIQEELFSQPPGPPGDPAELVLPVELRKDLDILSGNAPAEPFAPNVQHNNPSAMERFLAERAKKTEKKHLELSNCKILVMDVATEEGRTEYERFMQEIVPQAASEPQRWKVTETSHPLVLDASAKEGYRLIKEVRYFQCEEKVIPGDHGFHILKRNEQNPELQSGA